MGKASRQKANNKKLKQALGTPSKGGMKVTATDHGAVVLQFSDGQYIEWEAETALRLGESLIKNAKIAMNHIAGIKAEEGDSGGS